MENPAALTKKYMAFISYSHADNREDGRKWADWLHHSLETYEVPTELVGQKNQSGETIPNQIFPVFQDEKELSASHSLESSLHTNLQNSEHLIFLSSPKSANSVYVQNELVYYKQIGKADKIIALILSGEPEYGDQNSENQCFPDALRFQVDENGNILKDKKEEPLAADVRIPGTMQEGFTSPENYRRFLTSQGKFSNAEIATKTNEYKERLELAKLKIIAGVLDVPLGELTKRDKAYQLEKQKEKNRRMKRIATAISGLAILAIILGIFAWTQKNKALKTLAFSLFSSGVNKVQNGENSDGAAYLAASARYGNKNAAMFGQSLLTSISSDYRVPNIDNIYQIAYSPDAKWLFYTVSFGDKKVPQIFNLETRKKGNMLKEFGVNNFSPIKIDNNNLAYFVDNDKRLIRWNFIKNSAEMLASDNLKSSQVNSFGVSPDGNFALAYLEDNSQSLIDLKQNKVLKTGIQRSGGKNNAMPNYYFSENSKTVGSVDYYSFGNQPTEVKIFDLENPSAPEKSFKLNLKNPEIKFDKSGKRMIINGTDALYAFDLQKDAQPRLLKNEGRSDTFINPDGKTITINKFDGELIDFATGNLIKTVPNIINLSLLIKGFDGVNNSVSPDYTQELVSVNNQAMMQSFVTKPLLYNQFITKPGVFEVSAGSDENTVFVSYKFSPMIEKWNADTNHLDEKFINNQEVPAHFEVFKTKKMLYTISPTQNVKFFSTETGKQVGKTVKLGSQNAKFVFINKDETQFVGKISSTEIGIWNIESGKLERKITNKKLSKYLISDNLQKIFMVDNDGKWKMQDVKSGENNLQGTKALEGVKFSGDGKNVMVFYSDGNVEIIDLKNFKPSIKLKSIPNATGDFSNNGEYFAISEDVNLVRIWSVKDKKPIGESIPVTQFSGFFRFSEDGSKIFVTDKAREGLQQQISIFDTKTGKSLTVPFATSRIAWTDIFPGEKRVLTLNADTQANPVVSIWEIPGQLNISDEKLATNLENYFGKKYDLETGTISSFSGKNNDKEWFFQDPYSRTVTPNSKFTIMDKVKEYIPIKSVKQVEILTNNYIYHPYTRAVLAFHYSQQPETAYVADILYKMTKIQLNKVKDPRLKTEIEKLLALTAQRIYTK